MTDATNSNPTKAVLYVRVSSQRQVNEGHGLESQATRCREYAECKGYKVVEVFEDRAVSGSLSNRPGVMAMLSYLRKNSHNNDHAVIIDDISRLARDILVHNNLRISIILAGGKLESPNIVFGETSDDKLTENLLASVSQHHREKNKEQTIDRTRARAMGGYWVYSAARGYKYKKVDGHGKLLVRVEPIASIIQEALEGFASGRFETQGEIKRFLESQPEFPKDRRTGKVRYEEVVRLLRRPQYAGYIEIPKLGVALRKGHHEGLISLETFNKIQNRMKEGARAPARTDINLDFPLRGAVCCGDCENPLTSCWSKSKTGKKHPYYMCFRKGCVSYRKSIKRDEIKGAFETLLKQLSPSAKLFQYVQVIFKHEWERRLGGVAEIKNALRRDVLKIERQVEQLVDRIVESQSATLITAYESRLSKLERDKLIVAEKLEKDVGTQRGFDEMFELALNFFSNPWKLWASEHIEDKRTVLKLAFDHRLTYHRKEGFRTPKTTLP
ncbi:MAG: recombinase family protein, partial [Rhizobiales bacterium]|nr:recombinase family protein [Hyphomicrobiales bacterium]